MAFLDEESIGCPYCGECITVLLNSDEVGHEYIEDCQVCCRPIVFNVQEGGGGGLVVMVRAENETY